MDRCLRSQPCPRLCGSRGSPGPRQPPAATLSGLRQGQRDAAEGRAHPDPSVAAQHHMRAGHPPPDAAGEGIAAEQRAGGWLGRAQPMQRHGLGRRGGRREGRNDVRKRARLRVDVQITGALRRRGRRVPRLKPLHCRSLVIEPPGCAHLSPSARRFKAPRAVWKHVRPQPAAASKLGSWPHVEPALIAHSTPKPRWIIDSSHDRGVFEHACDVRVVLRCHAAKAFALGVIVAPRPGFPHRLGHIDQSR